MNYPKPLALLGLAGLLAACGNPPPSQSSLIVPVCVPIQYAPGTLDTCFSADGKQTTAWTSTSYEGAEAVAIQTDGKIVVGGTLGLADEAFVLARYSSNGLLDASFSPRYRDGKIKTSFGSRSFLSDIALQGDGKIVAVGHTLGATWDLALARYNGDGTLDTSFDGDGKLTSDFSGFDDYAYAVAIQDDGKILVAGYSSNDMILARFNPDGSLDTGFDGDGKVSTDFASSYDVAQAVVVQSDGKIVLGGSSNNSFALARYNSDGSLDSSFDLDGKTTIAFGSGAHSLALQADGKLLLAGYGFGSDEDFALARFNSDGSLDTTFDGDGMATSDFGASYDVAYSVMVQADGKIVLVGTSNAGGTTDFALARYNLDGSLDTSFDGDGKATSDIGTASNDIAYDAALQSNGRIVSVGMTYTPTLSMSDFALTRHLP